MDVDGGVDDGEVQARELLELEEGVAQHVDVDLDGVCFAWFGLGRWGIGGGQEEDAWGVGGGVGREKTTMWASDNAPEKSMSMCGELSSRQTM